MFDDWILTSWSSVVWVLLSTVGIYLAVIVLTRLNGLRSFAKMSAFDFATTVATGSLLAATVASENPPVLRGVVAIAALFLMQHLVARLRVGSSVFRGAVDNAPLLLLRDGELLRSNLQRARITEADLWSHLRAANIGRLEEVRAVVLETTGDISVLHGNDVDDRLLAGVRE